MILMEMKDNLIFFLNAAEDSSKPEKRRGRKKEKMEETLKKLLKDMEDEKEQKKENKKAFQEGKEEFKEKLDEAKETIILVTENNCGMIGEVGEILTAFTRLANALMQNGIKKDQLLFAVKLATIEEDSEDFLEKGFSLIAEYLAEHLKDE